MYNKSKFSSLESPQDAGGWPAVFCFAPEGHHGLASQFNAAELIIIKFLVKWVCTFSDNH